MNDMEDKIVATGLLYGQKVTVTLTKGKQRLNFAIDDQSIARPANIRFRCSQDFFEPIDEMCTFPKNSLRSGYDALHNNFFDNDDFEITVYEELEKIPYEEGHIY